MSFFILLSTILYITGLLNIIKLSKKNILSVLIASEIMFLGVDTFLIISAIIFNHTAGIVQSVFILMLTVGESAVGLSLCILSLKLNKNLNF